MALGDIEYCPCGCGLTRGEVADLRLHPGQHSQTDIAQARYLIADAEFGHQTTQPQFELNLGPLTVPEWFE